MGDESAQAAVTLRPLMLSIAYRMVGSFSEAEDLVQEAYLRLHQEDVENPKAWLTTVTTRLAIDHLKSAWVRREQYPGTWLPEPVLADPAPGAAERAETLSLAFLVVLETLSPVERAVFLLRDVFDYGFDEIAQIVGKSTPNCRQIAVRARRRVQEREPRFEASRERRDELARRFIAAVEEGETEPLIELLAADAAYYGDGGGKAPAIPKPLHGREKVARFLLGLGRVARRDRIALHPAEVNGQPGAVAVDADGRVVSVLSLEIADGAVQAIRGMVNPEKMAHISSTILPSLPPALKRS
jgi:RNA polymerase sigma-70 factor (TIGR02957 family)